MSQLIRNTICSFVCLNCYVYFYKSRYSSHSFSYTEKILLRCPFNVCILVFSVANVLRTPEPDSSQGPQVTEYFPNQASHTLLFYNPASFAKRPQSESIVTSASIASEQPVKSFWRIICSWSMLFLEDHSHCRVWKTIATADSWRPWPLQTLKDHSHYRLWMTIATADSRKP